MARIGVAQFTGSRDPEENAAAVHRLTLQAAEAGVNLLCFHELANTVYLPFAEDPELFALAEPEDGPSVTAAQALARQTEMVLVYPFFEEDGGRYYNSAVVFGPRGEKLTKYRKTSVPSSRLLPDASERYFFEPGNLGFPVVDTPFGVRVGLIICYDRNLPEPARCVALNGAHLLFVPVTTTQLVRPWWELLLRTRAVENVLYLGAASRVGEDKGGSQGTHYIGESLIIDPRGEIIGHGSIQEEQVVWSELDMDLLQRQRKIWLFLEDRQPSQYGLLSEPSHVQEKGKKD